MDNFITFVEKAQKASEIIAAGSSILQLSVKNFEQLGILCSHQEIRSVRNIVCNSIKSCLESHITGEIYEYNKFFYFIIKDKNPERINKLALDLRDQIISESANLIFMDVKIIACPLSNESELSDIIMLLANQINYSNKDAIFSFISEPSLLIDKIKQDYQLLRELKLAIEGKTACFAFQPVITCKTGEIAYHECLLRLSNDDYKLVSAGKYIMLAERYGFVIDVDKYVFDMAVRELQSSDNIKLSVNLSNIAVQDKIISSYILDLIRKSSTGDRIIIEITETAFNDNFEATKYFVDTAKSMGCKIALDDFGAGYTSFNQIRNFAIDIIKIDGCFIRGLDENHKNRVLVETLIKTSEELGCKTVAEFVENGSIAKQLIDLKVDYMQGNFFSPAINYRTWKKK
ncbi:MAG: EAL domain-containing protein [Rickettsiaceae bacterium]|nr:EAL domain-containing protein [Rickettsiaceae bacterium]